MGVSLDGGFEVVRVGAGEDRRGCRWEGAGGNAGERVDMVDVVGVGMDVSVGGVEGVWVCVGCWGGSAEYTEVIYSYGGFTTVCVGAWRRGGTTCLSLLSV